MIQINNKENCCGCTACVNICPKHCISMKSDEEGFFYPRVDKAQCVNCGCCEKVCPIIHYEKAAESLKVAAIVQNIDKNILSESTSGGFFTALAEHIVDKGGLVVGAYLDESNRVKHFCIDSKNEIYKFRNSKYVQSDIGKTFLETKKNLEKGRIVCFSGTPCQIFALKTFLGKEYSNLVLVDVVCRAVPSPGVWDKYVNYKENEIGHIKSIRFRDKKLGYQYSTMCLTSIDGKKERGGIESDQWLRMFFSGMIIRPSCTKCAFRNPERYSDFTIWDCFNIYRIDRSFKENVGTTRVLIHSSKGLSLFEEIKDCFIYKMIPYDLAISGCKEMYESPQFHPKRKEFFEDYNNMEMGDLLTKYFPINLSVKIKKRMRLFLNKLGIDIIIKHLLKKG